MSTFGGSKMCWSPDDTKTMPPTCPVLKCRCRSAMQEKEPAPEGASPGNAKAARIAHTLGALEELPASYTGARCCCLLSLYIYAVC